MKILLLSDRVSDRGGADLHLVQVAKSMADLKHEITWLHGRVEGTAPSIEGVEFGIVPSLASKTPSKSDKSGRLSALKAALSRADLIHIQNVMNPTLIRMATDLRKTVITIQDHRVFCPGSGKTLPKGETCRSWMNERSCAECLPDADYLRKTLALTQARLDAIQDAEVIVLSNYMARELMDANVKRPHVIPPWVKIGEAPQAGSGFVIGGRLVQHKGVLDSLKAYTDAQVPMPLITAGEGPLNESFPPSYRRGWLPESKWRRLLHESRALIFSSRWQEPLGIAAIESLAEGTPVIVIPSGGTEEWHGKGCVLVERERPDLMVQAIRTLAENQEMAVSLGEEGQESVKRFNREKIEQDLLAVYDTARA